MYYSLIDFVAFNKTITYIYIIVSSQKHINSEFTTKQREGCSNKMLQI